VLCGPWGFLAAAVDDSQRSYRNSWHRYCRPADSQGPACRTATQEAMCGACDRAASVDGEVHDRHRHAATLKRVRIRRDDPGRGHARILCRFIALPRWYRAVDRARAAAGFILTTSPRFDRPGLIARARRAAEMNRGGGKFLSKPEGMNMNSVGGHRINA